MPTFDVMPDIRETERFSKWFKSLRDRIAVKAITKRLVRLAAGLYGDCKRIENIFELRVDVGPGYRIYFTKKENRIILLLVGGDKSTQGKDIALAKELAKQDIELI